MCVVVLLSVGFVEDGDGSEYSALVGLHDVPVDNHLVQHHVGSINVEHYLCIHHNRVKETSQYKLHQFYIYVYVSTSMK